MQLNIYKVVATQRASTLVAALKPAEQTHRVEGVLARSTALVRCLHIRRDDRVTDSTLTLSLQGTLDVATEC